MSPPRTRFRTIDTDATRDAALTDQPIPEVVALSRAPGQAIIAGVIAILFDETAACYLQQLRLLEHTGSCTFRLYSHD